MPHNLISLSLSAAESITSLTPSSLVPAARASAASPWNRAASAC